MYTKINDIKEEVGQKVVIALKVKDVTESKTRTGSKYVTITATDGKKEIRIKRWNTSASNLEDYMVAENIVVLDLKIGEYNGEKDFTFERSRELEIEDNVDKEQYKDSPSLNITEMANYISHKIDEISDLELKKVVEEVIRENADNIKKWAAASGVHHNIKGGLLYHMYRMTKVAIALSEIYDLDKDILVADVVCHDVGKLIEMTTDDNGKATYTVKGRLFGHLYIGGLMVHETAVKLGLENNDKVMQLEHAIISHHGKQEWDAIKKPATAEAYALFLIDMIDSRMYIYEDSYNKMEEEEISSNPIKYLDNAFIYKGKRS